MSGKPFPFVWTDERMARLVKAWNAGVPASMLAERFGLSEASIVKKIVALRAAGVELRVGENAQGALRKRKARAMARLRLYVGLIYEQRRPRDWKEFSQ